MGVGGRPRFRRILVAVSLAALLSGAAVAADNGASAPNRARVEAKVLRQLATNGTASFWIVLRDEADLAGTTRIHDRSRRGEVVYKRLTAVARRSQAPVRAILDAQGVRYRPFWIVNAIRVKAAGQGTLDAVAARPEVREILATRSYPVPKPIKARPSSPLTTEWGLNAINAPQVWSMFNDRGEGIVVANIDTGVRYSHTAI